MQDILQIFTSVNVLEIVSCSIVPDAFPADGGLHRPPRTCASAHDQSPSGIFTAICLPRRIQYDTLCEQRIFSAKACSPEHAAHVQSKKGHPSLQMRCPCRWNRGLSPFLCKNLAQETSPPLMYTCARFFVMNPHGHSFTPAADHPRIRGEKDMGVPVIALTQGSPPHTRGKVECHVCLVEADGITPAYAGKSKRHNFSIHNCKGSPPHTRGKASSLDGRKPQRGEDHPRIRGEKLSMLPSGRLGPGSPPHTRGKGAEQGLRLAHGGITPAYAGKRISVLVSLTTDKDHPRIRGEKQSAAVCRSSPQGSPPHTRGKVSTAATTAWNGRITPAYAGKSPCHPLPRRCGPDHPRIRGEKLPEYPLCKALIGSPPHTRGKVSEKRTFSEGPRITPAYAGKRILLMTSIADSGDHPRIRGEK